MIGLVPLALGLSEGALLSAALATVVIGGLLTSTLLTLIVIPVVYSLLIGARDRVMGRRPTPRKGEGGTRETRVPARVGEPPAEAAAGAPRERTPVGAGLTSVLGFASRAEAEGARSFLSHAGMQADRLVVRPGPGGALRGRSRLTQLAVDWLRRRQPELLATGQTWELAAPPPVAVTARTVLAGNGLVDHIPARGQPRG
jgi:hypothetical protein